MSVLIVEKRRNATGITLPSVFHDHDLGSLSSSLLFDAGPYTNSPW